MTCVSVAPPRPEPRTDKIMNLVPGWWFRWRDRYYVLSSHRNERWTALAVDVESGDIAWIDGSTEVIPVLSVKAVVKESVWKSDP